ncbi:DUF397 domain-containing protein [Streptomyces hoynatensis]|uniref:DUF397 domain-containing protein n=1 Tax=Streptomyces hoynatensis TaxID=1141874 RepID=A0A3A9YT86_9ACTN|nr:DUF397 domain-containing protein [Streptomyces hoynatensis]RKN39190.1 DUF397 domain-containing protein [Streptomyces hoynatensis]
MSTELAWFKSSYSGDEGGNCLEVVACKDTVRVRDSKDPEGPHLAIRPATWAEFTRFTGLIGAHRVIR